MSGFTKVATAEEIPPGESASFQVGDRIVAIFNDDGQFFAIDDLCPHMGASLAAGHVEEGEVICPWHAWRFCIRDGTWCDNPRIKIDSFPVRVEEGAIFVNLESDEDS